jgi:tRNA1(Val) A37 N6-methylase TrmN6
MELKELKPRKALNKAFLKVKPNRTEIEGFKTNLIQLLDRTNDTESEEFHKNLVIDFLKKTYYDPNHFINTKGRNDLVIHNGNNASSSVGVIIEAKKPTNKTEMITTKKLNAKAFQELVLYYLRERITHKNLEVKHLVATNINEWFIFDATLFDRLFAQNKNLVKQFNDFEGGRLADTKTDFFYKQIAEPFIADIKTEIEFTYFDLQEYQKPLRNADKADDNKLIALFKLLSAEHLLKLPFTNDSNSLDKRFYSELLHIIGLTETKEGSKKLIERTKEGERNSGSILEDAIIQLDSLDKINRLDRPSQFGSTQQERLFNVGLELSITWINRILFLKLLEAQLITYHKGDKSYSFLSLDKIKNYDDLNSLFFQVLARKYDDRNQDVKKAFEKVPYLNSSLFEPTEIEQVTLFISNLKDDKTIPVISSTVLKNDQGKKQTGNLKTLAYLFDFLNAYDFTSEGSEEIQEDNKSLINASVLGLIFEKINGYKDGSFFTPGFITMYMCRETIRKSVVQKFNETKKWNCSTVDELYDKIEDRKEANDIVNSIKICDPAVGSGHFLVSALNEMIAVKNDLKILQDRTGKRLKEYQVEVVNDELIVTDEEGELFDYNPTNKESQRIQETLFHEKQTIIENCLFGVDINPNSVKICRLRLWIELLKNAYYKAPSPSERAGGEALETLPNIDINIKCGNSLVSRFAIDADLSQALKKSKWSIDSYRIAVDTYRNAENKEQKREMEKLITDIKSDFRIEISLNDPKVQKLRKLSGDLFTMTKQTQLFEMSKKEKSDWNKKVSHLTEETKKLETEIEEIKANKIFENAFEWRFEFPEVLNDDGDFIGFDVVIGNPPYINFRDIKNIGEKQYYLIKYKVSEYQSDLFILFIELAFEILKSKGEFAFIIPNSITNNLNNSKIRKHILETASINSIVNTPIGVFPDATVDTVVIVATNENNIESNISVLEIQKQTIIQSNKVNQSEFLNNENYYFDFLTSNENRSILGKIEKSTISLNDISDSSSGIKEYETGKGKPPQTENDRINKVFNSNEKIDEFYRKHIQGNDVNNYVLNWKGGYLKYGDWIAAPREPKYFEGERIIIREIPGKNRLIAAYTEQNYTVKNTAHIFKIHSDYDCKFIIALLNSKLMGYYFVNKFSERDNVFPKAKIGQCRLLPIRKCEKEKQSPFIELIKQLIEIKSKEITSDTTDLEKEIDQLVYKLYDLTEEEIKIIEGK